MKKYDKVASRAARDEGIRRAVAAAHPEWKEKFVKAVRYLAKRNDTMTTDDVRKFLDEKGIHLPKETRAFGGLMKQAASRGYIRRTDRTRESDHVASHRREKRVWESLL